MAHAQLLAARVGRARGAHGGAADGPPAPDGAAVPHSARGRDLLAERRLHDTMRAVVEGQIDGMPDVRHVGLGEIRLVGGVLGGVFLL